MTVQVFCYPEDAVLTGPGPLCELVAGLGAGRPRGRRSATTPPAGGSPATAS